MIVAAAIVTATTVPSRAEWVAKVTDDQVVLGNSESGIVWFACNENGVVMAYDPGEVYGSFEAGFTGPETDQVTFVIDDGLYRFPTQITIGDSGEYELTETLSYFRPFLDGIANGSVLHRDLGVNSRVSVSLAGSSKAVKTFERSCAGLSADAPAPEVVLIEGARPARCELVVNGDVIDDGQCAFRPLGTDGSFQITIGQHETFAQVLVERPGIAEGVWNEGGFIGHAHAPLGPLYRHDACWVGPQARVCAW
jgi:hypothetical protein